MENQKIFSGNRIYLLTIVVILLTAITFRIYKADYTGILHDEVITLNLFSKDVNTALNSYQSTNNHVINSILICFVRKHFGSYEQFLRIPSTFFGIWLIKRIDTARFYDAIYVLIIIVGIFLIWQGVQEFTT